MRKVLALLLGVTVGYMGQNISASNGHDEILSFVFLGLIISFVTYIMIGHSHGQQR